MQNGLFLSPNTLYVLNSRIVKDWFDRGVPELNHVNVLDRLAVLPPRREASVGPKFFIPRSPEHSLYDLVSNCRNDCAIILSVCQDGRKRLPKKFIALISQQNGKVDMLTSRGSYVAIIMNGWVVKEKLSTRGDDVVLRGSPFGFDVEVSSGAASGSEHSSIRVNGVETSPSLRGFNAIRVEPSGISAIMASDTQKCGRYPAS